MNANDFAKNCAAEKAALVADYFDQNSESAVASTIRQANLNPFQLKIVRRAIDQACTDSFYTLLLALAGCASLNGVQETFQLSSERGDPISNELEGHAWEHFYGSDA